MSHIAVIIPAYNVEKYIGTCLDSVLNQTIHDWTCFIMNDGSTDNTLSIAESYAQKDNRFRVFSQTNHGLTTTYNNLFEKAQQSEKIEYLFILDSDDFIHPKTFEILLNAIQKNEADLAECSWIRVAPNAVLDTTIDLPDTISSKTITNFDIYFSKTAAQGLWINKWNKLYKWDKIKHLRFDEKLTNEDDFWYETLVHQSIDKKVILDVPLYYYRKNENSLTSSLNFEKYVKSGIRRIHLSYETFVKTNKVPHSYQSIFMKDLTNDAYRMILQKNIKRNKNKVQNKQLFLLAGDTFKDLIDNQKIDVSHLGFFKRMAVWATYHRYYYLTKLFVRISSF